MPGGLQLSIFTPFLRKSNIMYSSNVYFSREPISVNLTKWAILCKCILRFLAFNVVCGKKKILTLFLETKSAFLIGQPKTQHAMTQASKHIPGSNLFL